jgi:hypothetical protein
LSCPFFLPRERADDIAFPHPGRLPLGRSWRGTCSAPGHEHETLNPKELESCNLGYAKSCSRLPKERSSDAVRFIVIGDTEERVSVEFVLEREYLPVGHGRLQFDQRSREWISPHPDGRIQKKAECFLDAYFERTNRRR